MSQHCWHGGNFKKPRVARLNAALNRPSGSPLPFPTNNSPGVLQPGISQLLDQLMSSNPELKSLDFLAEQERARIALARIAIGHARHADASQSPGVFNGSIRPTEWHATVGYENPKGKNTASFITSVSS